MTEERKKKLNEIGFQWKVEDLAKNHNSKWNQYFDQLIEVEMPPKKLKKLQKWCKSQRKQYRRLVKRGKSKKLNRYQVLAMQKIGFNWIEQGKEATMSSISEKIPKKWNKRFREFEQYQQDNGNNIPPSAKLSKWILSQRKHYRKLLKQKTSKQLSLYQVGVLNECRFPWISWKDDKKSS